MTETTDPSHSIVGKWSVYATQYFDLNIGNYGTGNTITFYNDGTYKVDDKSGNGTRWEMEIFAISQ